jgi:hypothetical protein
MEVLGSAPDGRAKIGASAWPIPVRSAGLPGLAADRRSGSLGALAEEPCELVVRLAAVLLDTPWAAVIVAIKRSSSRRTCRASTARDEKPALSGKRAAHTESRGGVSGVGPAFAPALVFDGGSDMPHAHFERERVILVHSAQLLHVCRHVRHRAAGQALHTDELSASGLGEAGNRARFNPVKLTHAHSL